MTVRPRSRRWLAAACVALGGCGAAAPNHHPRIVVLPTIVGCNMNASEDPDCFEQARRQLREEATRLERSHRCRAGQTLVITPPSSATCTSHPPQTEPHRTGGLSAGETVVAQSGCLACHRIGDQGNPGPGPDLSNVGERLPKAAIEHVLLEPQPPMPSFRRLPPAQFKALVAYLTRLR